MNKCQSPYQSNRDARRGALGFTLVEMAVVITLIAIAMTLGLRLLQATQESAAWSETRLKQERIKVALVSFLRTNGRLPCPNSVAPWDGAEDTPCLVNAGRGIVPWQAVGLSVGDAQDGWGNFFTYRVANRTPITSSNWTLTAGATAFTISELTAPLTTFTLQERDAVGVLGAAVVPSPVTMLISHGKNGSGARTLRGTLIAAPTGADELANAGVASTAFVSRAPTDVAAAAGGIFDDVVASMNPRDLLQPLVDDKTLKGSSAAYYREQAMQQVALTSCIPPQVAPSLLAIQPNIGNGTIVYACPAGGAYFCRTPTPVSNASTLAAQQLYQLSLFGAAPADVTYGQLLAAFAGISTRCP
ncbi:MAG: type II secretion system protein [Rhodoferax sp.]|uniref:type II secretion system protein n=1 Tax=Rhodoferax sp. TaxID=50421 RepID=UPI001400169F|nr:prepilin-type N-terminal cleavage/methylation domain-containing protein [Rhodoferax sp.]NDP40262.1 type II secretion system protein [Rhodoferax sp.]